MKRFETALELRLVRFIVPHTGSHPQECISDLCAYKPDISRKIRSGKICPDCRKTLEARLGTETLMAVSTLLETISQATAPTKPGSGAEDFPALARVLATRSRD